MDSAIRTSDGCRGLQAGLKVEGSFSVEALLGGQCMVVKAKVICALLHASPLYAIRFAPSALALLGGNAKRPGMCSIPGRSTPAALRSAL